MKKRNRNTSLKTIIVTVLLIFSAVASITYITSCGGRSGSTHAPVAQAAASVTGMVLLRSANAQLSRSAGQKEATRQAGQAPGSCGAVPDGFVAVAEAAVTATGESGSVSTDSNGCFSMDIFNTGVKVFTVRKTNSKGGTTVLKKTADVQPNTIVEFVEDEAITIESTVAAMVVEEKLAQNEENIDPGAIENISNRFQDTKIFRRSRMLLSPAPTLKTRV